MSPILRNIIAVVAGWGVGSMVMMSLIKVGHRTYPIEGIDPDNIDMEVLAAAMQNLGAEYFIFPFLAHAAGALVGATVAAIIAKQNKKRAALIVGGIFLLGGIAMSFMIPAPIWFVLLDNIVAYIPMAFIGNAQHLE